MGDGQSTPTSVAHDCGAGAIAAIFVMLTCAQYCWCCVSLLCITAVCRCGACKGVVDDQSRMDKMMAQPLLLPGLTEFCGTLPFLRPDG